MSEYYVYILASRWHGALYIGVTNDLVRRVSEYKNGAMAGFTRKYHVNQLVFFECTDDIAAVIAREKQLKKWKRVWKLQLIEAENPQWRDLYEDIAQG